MVTSGVHDVKDNWEGVHLNAITELRHFHYRGLSSRREENLYLCTKLWTDEKEGKEGKDGEGDEVQGDGKVGEEKERKLVRNEEMAKLAAMVRSCPRGSKKVRHHIGGW